MIWIIVVVVALVLFVVSIVSPRTGGKIEHKSNVKASELKRYSNWFWNPLTWSSKKTIETVRKIIKFTAESGRNIRKKLPF